MIGSFEEFEDKTRLTKVENIGVNRYSKYCDLVYYTSSRDPGLMLGMRVLKPEKPSYILAGTHGWHMSIPEFAEYGAPQSDYLQLQIDMRGRAFSNGCPDCNGWELFDIIDAIEYAKKHYAQYILDPEVVYFQAGSGGGGNAFAIAGKFPDYFAHVVAMTAMSDYALWYRNDARGEFRDELEVWIGSIENEMAYASRSGLTVLPNLCSPMAIVHGDGDIRVPEYHSSIYVDRAKALGKRPLLHYYKMHGVGGPDHFSFITDWQMDAMKQFCEAQRQAHRMPVQIPRRGKMVIAGYLVTKAFSVILKDIDRVAEIFYDLDSKTFTVTGAQAGEYTLEVF